MKKKLIKSKAEWDKLREELPKKTVCPFPIYESPNSYPCIVVYGRTLQDNSVWDCARYLFVYPKNFSWKE